MSSLREAAQQALEALMDDCLVKVGPHSWERRSDLAITALKAALAEPVECPHGVTDGNCKECYEAKAEPVQEPVGWESSEDGRTIQNNDFTHDVVLRVTGDFENDKQRISYAKRVVDKLNAPALAEPVQEPVAWMYSDDHERMLKTETFCTVYSVKVGSPDKGVTDVPLYTAPPQQALTIERLRDALVASRIIPPTAVEDPDEYDDGVTLFRIEALHRRIT